MSEPYPHLASHVVCSRLQLPDIDQLHGGGLLVAHLGGGVGEHRLRLRGQPLTRHLEDIFRRTDQLLMFL